MLQIEFIENYSITSKFPNTYLLKYGTSLITQSCLSYVPKFFRYHKVLKRDLNVEDIDMVYMITLCFISRSLQNNWLSVYNGVYQALVSEFQ